MKCGGELSCKNFCQASISPIISLTFRIILFIRRILRMLGDLHSNTQAHGNRRDSGIHRFEKINKLG